MNLILQILTGSKYGQRIVIGPNEIRTIGRSAAAQHSFEDDDHMSSIHFEVENYGDHAEVRDRRSTNRTWLNNAYIAQATLKHGDRLRAGKTILGVELDFSTSGRSDSFSSVGSVIRPASASSDDLSGTIPPPPKPPVPEVAPMRADLGPAAVTPAHGHPIAPPVAPPIMHQHRDPLPSASAALGNGHGARDGMSGRGGYGSEPVSSPMPSPPAMAAPPYIQPSPYQAPIPPRAPIAPQLPPNGPSPIESSDLVADILPPRNDAPMMPQLRPTPQPSNSNSPISESSVWFSEASSLGTRRFRMYDRPGDFQTLQNLRSVINALRLKKSVRVVVHFAKIRMETPNNLAHAIPVYPNVPAARTHWPVSLTYSDWESETVQSVALRLSSADALMVMVSEFNTDLDAEIHAIGQKGMPGFCEAQGFFGWSWPSTFYGMVQIVGSQRWSEVLGPVIEGVIMASPMHQNRLLAFAADSLASDLEPLGFRCEL